MARDPGEWYEEKRLEAERLERELATAKVERPYDAAKVERLTRALEQARYVGD